MNQELFVARGAPRWRAFEELLAAMESRKQRGGRDFPRLYRAICHDLALARQRRFDAHLVDRLNSLALRGHQHLYESDTVSWRQLVDFWIYGLPLALRREASVVILAALLFYLPGLTLAFLIQIQPELVYSVLDPSTVAGMESMYDPASEHHLRPRGYDSDAAMFGFYIRNNMGIGFRTFASGIFGGLGSFLLLVYNSVVFGAVSGHLIQIGYTETFTSFVIGHGALELQAILLAAAAGFRLGWPLLAPGPYTRLDALKLSARRAVPLVYGASGLFLGAAVIEAFWSASTMVPAQIKYTVGGVLWLMVALYFFSGRRTA
jgi:uncharacterized membrane protein SpoIIM required for sporulation